MRKLRRTTRREFVRAASGAVLGLASGTSLAGTFCGPTMSGEHCVSEVSFGTFAATYDPQHQSQWCWAACVSMLFSYYGHPVSQERIVSEVYGGIVNMPAFTGFVIARQLDRGWTDDAGVKFRSSMKAVYDFDAGVSSIDNNRIIRALDDDTPLIIGARTHAMVMTAIGYMRTMYGPSVDSVGVFDPWPGVGARGLALDEMAPIERGGSLRFVALAQVLGA